MYIYSPITNTNLTIMRSFCQNVAYKPLCCYLTILITVNDLQKVFSAFLLSFFNRNISLLYQPTKIILVFFSDFLISTQWLTVNIFVTSVKILSFNINWLINFWMWITLISLSKFGLLKFSLTGWNLIIALLSILK